MAAAAPLTLCELRTLTTSTGFGHSVTSAVLEISGEQADISVPWEQGVWRFKGGEAPIPGTMLVVEISDDGQTELVGPVDRFYLASKHLSCCVAICMIASKYQRGDQVGNSEYVVESVMKISDHHEIYAVAKAAHPAQQRFALKVAVSEEGRRQNTHEIFVQAKLQRVAGVVALEAVLADEEALLLSLHGESMEDAVALDSHGHFRFSQVGKFLTSLLDSLALLHKQGVVLQNLCPRHILAATREAQIFPLTICDLSAVCREDSVVGIEDEFPDSAGEFLSPAVESGTRKRVCFVDDFWALLFTGLEISGVPMAWRQQTKDSLVLKNRFIQDARNFSLGDVPRGLQAALGLLAELEELPKFPAYGEVAGRLRQALTQLRECERLPPVPESLLVLAQDRVCPGVYTRISSSAVLLGALDARDRDVHKVRTDFAGFSEYGHVMQSVVKRLNPQYTRPLDKVLQRETINTCGFLYSVPGTRAAACSHGPVCLFALITGSCRVRDWCPLVHPKVPVAVQEIKSRKRKLCFRFLGTGACPQGKRCDKIHPLRADLDEWIENGKLADKSAYDRRDDPAGCDHYEFEDQVLLVPEEDKNDKKQTADGGEPRTLPSARRRPVQLISGKRMQQAQYDNKKRTSYGKFKDDRDIKRRRV